MDFRQTGHAAGWADASLPGVLIPPRVVKQSLCVPVVVLAVAACGPATAAAPPAGSATTAPSATAPAADPSGGPGTGTGQGTGPYPGDLLTMDPCSLADAGALARFGTVRVARGTALDTCAIVVVPTGTHKVVDVTINGGKHDAQPTGQAPSPGVEIGPHGRFTVARQTAPDPRGCVTGILVPPHEGITIETAPRNDESAGPDFCAINGVATDTALSVLDRDAVGHPGYPAGSVAGTAPCTLLPAAAVTALHLPGPALQPSPATEGSAHTCFFGPPDPPRTGFSSVSLSVDLDTVDTRHLSALGGRLVTVAGRPTYVGSLEVDPGNPASACEATTDTLVLPQGLGTETGAGPDSPTAGPVSRPRYEASRVIVHAAQGIDRLCQQALAVAAAAWPALPPS